MSLHPPDLIAGESAALAARTAARAAAEGLADAAYTFIDAPVGRLVAVATPHGLCGSPTSSRTAASTASSTASPRGCRRGSSRRPPSSTTCVASSTSTSTGAGASSACASTGARRRRLRAARARGGHRDPVRLDEHVPRRRARGRLAARLPAAGNALGHNPIPIIVPCHRVLASTRRARRLHRRARSQAPAARHRGRRLGRAAVAPADA